MRHIPCTRGEVRLEGMLHPDLTLQVKPHNLRVWDAVSEEIVRLTDLNVRNAPRSGPTLQTDTPKGGGMAGPRTASDTQRTARRRTYASNRLFPNLIASHTRQQRPLTDCAHATANATC